MTRLSESTKHAEKAAWPAVKAALAERTEPVVIEKLARTKQSRSNIRFVVEETIQAIAAAGLLRTPVDADVVGKAVNWHESLDDVEVDELMELDDNDVEVELYRAVGRLLREVGDRPKP